RVERAVVGRDSVHRLPEQGVVVVGPRNGISDANVDDRRVVLVPAGLDRDVRVRRARSRPRNGQDEERKDDEGGPSHGGKRVHRRCKPSGRSRASRPVTGPDWRARRRGRLLLARGGCMTIEMPSQVSGEGTAFDRSAGWCANMVSRAPFFAFCVLLILVWAPTVALFKFDTSQLIINTVTTI